MVNFIRRLLEDIRARSIDEVQLLKDLDKEIKRCVQVRASIDNQLHMLDRNSRRRTGDGTSTVQQRLSVADISLKTTDLQARRESYSRQVRVLEKLKHLYELKKGTRIVDDGLSMLPDSRQAKNEVDNLAKEIASLVKHMKDSIGKL